MSKQSDCGILDEEVKLVIIYKNWFKGMSEKSMIGLRFAEIHCSLGLFHYLCVII